MKIPTIFVPDKNQDKKLKDIIQDVKKIRKIKDTTSLACLPEIIGNYSVIKGFKEIDKKLLEYYFGKQIPKYVVETRWAVYKAPLSSITTSVYILKFKDGTNLDRLNKKIDLENEINQECGTRTRCLKKDNYLVAIKTNWTDNYSLDTFGSLYINNFGLERL